MTPAQALDVLAHLDVDELCKFLDLAETIVDTPAQAFVETDVPRRLAVLDPQTDPAVVAVQLEALFVLARVEAQTCRSSADRARAH